MSAACLTVTSTWPARRDGLLRCVVPDDVTLEVGDYVTLFDPEMMFTRHPVVAVRPDGTVDFGPAEEWPPREDDAP